MHVQSTTDASATSERRTPRSRGTILVFGATGQQGGAVAEALRSRGWPVRALVRDPRSARAKTLSGIGVDLVRGDLADAASIRRAMAEAYGVFSVQPNSGQGPSSGLTDEDEVRFGRGIADAAFALGVSHLVYSSAILLSKGPVGVPNLDCNLDVEAHLRSIDLRSTVVRPGTFMDLLVQPGTGLDQGVLSFFVRPDQTTPLIAVRDIGLVVAGVFGQPERYAGRAANLAGDAPTGLAMGAALSRAAGRPIRYQRFTEEVLAADPVLARLTPVFAPDRAEIPDIAALRRDFGDLLTFDAWLAGPGRPLLERALHPSGTPV